MNLLPSEIGKTLLWLRCPQTITFSKREDVLWRSPVCWLYEQWGIRLWRTGGSNYRGEEESFGWISHQEASMGKDSVVKYKGQVGSCSQEQFNATCKANGKAKACRRIFWKASTWRPIMGCKVATEQHLRMSTILVKLCHTWLVCFFCLFLFLFFFNVRCKFCMPTLNSALKILNSCSYFGYWKQDTLKFSFLCITIQYVVVRMTHLNTLLQRDFEGILSEFQSYVDHLWHSLTVSTAHHIIKS